MGNRADPTLGLPQKYPITYGTGNARNGHSAKTLTRDFGNSPWTFLSTGKARSNHNGSSSIRPTGMRFDDKSSHCMVREIQSHLEEIDGAEVSLSPISAVTDAVTGRPRALDPLYPILSQDCIHVKVREAGAVRTKAVYLAIGVNLAGHKDMLGL